jgi:2-amino-4-hydroxy-6-hydroxymethyldihydropteridine diphosphokinase
MKLKMNGTMNKVYLLLGSNMGEPAKGLAMAGKKISKQVGKILRFSSTYQTAAWGKTDQPDFLNQVLVVETTLSANTCLETILNIEAEMGRIRTVKNAPRVIDIDILYYNKAIIQEANLIVPHPAIAARRFVLIPLNQIAPSFVHPVHKKNNHQLLLECKDPLDVKKI